MSKRGTADRILLSICLVLTGTLTLQAQHRPLTPEEQRKVDQAIERGVHFLKSQQFSKGPHAGTWLPYPPTETRYRVGYTLMPTLALLECGVSPDDVVIQRSTTLLRRVGLKLEFTYELSLAVLVLDHMNDPKDTPLLTSLALRILAGQCRSGGWNYRCPRLSNTNEAALLKLLREEVSGQKQEIPQPLRVLTIFQRPEDLSWIDPKPEAADWAREPLFVGSADNSNTQFALLALQAAQRHDIPMKQTLRLAAKRFQTSQNSDGTWGYRYRAGGGMGGCRSMTTVGLLGLAIAKVLPKVGGEEGDPLIDPSVFRGFAALSREIDAPTDQMKRRLPQPDLYFMWSVERVAMLYKLKQIGGRDWYRWGAEILVSNQTRRGEWPPGTVDVLHPITREVRDTRSTWGPTLNTSFALLFLKRSNLTKDLTAKLPYKPEELNKGILQALDGLLPLPQQERPIPSTGRH